MTLVLNPAQSRAVDLITSARKRVTILTGGPGTGKTTSVKLAVEEFERRGRRVALCAPTGKAARRMRDSTGRRATTIHKLLEPQPVGKGEDGKLRFGFKRNAENPIQADVIIVDETSMLEIPLASKLLSALPRHARLVLVGDTNQLPPVGPGLFLADLIACGVVPSVELTEIMRQAADSKIVTACHEIKDGRTPSIDNAQGDNLLFCDLDEPEQIMERVLSLVFQEIGAHPDYPGIDPLRSIQVLSPTRDKGPLSCAKINEEMQKRANPPREGDDGRLRVGDKVIQLRNDYELDLVNGDIGFIRAHKSIDGRPFMDVEFDDLDSPDGKRRVEIHRFENALDLAYCCTVHKYQGSESRVVVIPLHSSQPAILLQRAWIYTAISRAKSLCILVGDRGIVGRAVRRVSAQRRITHLADMLQSKGE